LQVIYINYRRLRDILNAISDIKDEKETFIVNNSSKQAEISPIDNINAKFIPNLIEKTESRL